jgi:hypothetical protein
MSELEIRRDAATGREEVVNDPQGPMGEEGMTCFVCGGLPTATWMGRGVQFHSVCTECALEKLPLLIADAVAGGFGTRAQTSFFEMPTEKILAAYWRGVAYAMERRAKDARDASPASTPAD